VRLHRHVLPRLARSSELIEAYRTAQCVTPTRAEGAAPPTRGWNARVRIAGDVEVTIKGADMVWGKITLRYEPGGESVTPVAAGDYIYPADVRLGASRDRLFVKARGLAGGRHRETWLYEYDLRARKRLRRQNVDPAALPEECAMSERR
jgi:hypothetical protein